MSTYLYLLCLDHDPPLRADDESGQHLYDLPRIRSEIANRERVAEGPHYFQGTIEDDASALSYFRCHSARFLAQHPNCRIGIRDEYGVDHDENLES